MTRREFFQRIFPLRDSASPPDASARAAGSSGNGEMRDVFLEAMRLGIDPATVDPRRLRTMLAENDSNHPTTDDKGAPGSDLAGLPDALRRPQQRGGPDGDNRR